MHLKYNPKIAAVILAVMAAASPVHATAHETVQPQEIIAETERATEAGTEDTEGEPKAGTGAAICSTVTCGGTTPAAKS